MMPGSPTADTKFPVHSAEEHTVLLGEDAEKALFGEFNRVLRTFWQVHRIFILVVVPC